MYEPSVKQHIAVLLFVLFLFKFISLIYLLFHLIKMSKLFSSPPSGCIARERTKTDKQKKPERRPRISKQ
jgi:magnesium-transporting ATPase (P-type)